MIFHEETIEVESVGSEWRRARKTHQCYCGEKITPGTRYLRKVEKVDGELSVTKEGDHLHTWERQEMTAYDHPDCP